MVILFDIDSLVYSSCYNVETAEDACYKFDEVFQSIVNTIELFHQVEEVIVFAFGKNNFRKKLSGSYKANRTKEQPKFFHQLKNYILKYYEPEQANGMETDDLIAIYQKRIGHENCIIVSIDKDYLQNEGLIYNYGRKEFIKVSKEDAIRNFYTQMITGDTADNVNFCKGYGKKYAEKAFIDVLSEFGYQRKVLRLFKKIYRNKARERFIQCYNLLKLG